MRITFPWFGPARPVVAVLRLTGVIAAQSNPVMASSLNAASLAPLIERAFSYRHLAAVLLFINSPGGSAVQSNLIAARIRALAEEKKVPVIAFVEDVAASGGYWLACAADEIYADAASIVGSIGVISATFGFQNLLEKIGVERRLYTSGEKKSFLDPFRPESPEDIERLRRIQKSIHESFIAWVRARRGTKLIEDQTPLWSGEFWTGADATRLGLIDGVRDARSLVQDRFGKKAVIKRISGRAGFFRFRRMFGQGMGAEDWMAALRAQAHWSRFGL